MRDGIEWQDLPNLRGRPMLTARATLAWHVTAKGSPRANLTLSKLLLQALGWQPGERVHVQASPGRTMLRVVPREDGKAISRDRSSANVVLYLDWVKSPKRPAETVPHRVEGHALVLTLPRWARPADEAAAMEAASVEDEREAADLVRAGKGGRFLADHFGWDMDRAAAFAQRVREQQARGEAA